MRSESKSGRAATFWMVALVFALLGGGYWVFSSQASPAPAPLATGGLAPTHDNRSGPVVRHAAPAKLEGERTALGGAQPMPPRILASWQDGAPLAGAKLHFVRAGELLAQAKTDADGRFVAKAPMEAGATVWATLGPLVMASAPVAQTAPTELIASLGTPFSGVATVGGVAPGRALTLALSAAPGQWPEAPASIRAAFGPHAQAGELSFTTDALGRFEVRGLPHAWAGQLRPPAGMRLTEGGTSLALGAPQPNLRINLETQPKLFGKAVSPQGAPIPGVRVSCLLEAKGPAPTGSLATMTSSTSLEQVTQADGTFAFPLGPQIPRSASLSLVAAGIGVAALEVEFDGLADYDTGPIRLSPLRNLEVFLHDTQGAPIEGAVVRSGSERSAPSNAQGLTRIDNLPLAAVELTADALGFTRAFVTAPRGAAEPFPVTLTPMASLAVTFTTAAGEPGRGIVLTLAGGTILQELDFDEGLAQYRLGASASGPVSVRKFADGHEETDAAFTADDKGHILAVGLIAGSPIQLAARDASGQSVTWTTSVTLQAGESRDLEVTLDAPVGFLEGKVTDKSGAPLYGARVLAIDAGRDTDKGIPAKAANANRDGHFNLGPLLSPKADLWIESYGLAPQVVLAHSVAEPLDVVLEEGFELTITATDDDTGTEWPCTSASAAWHGHDLGSSRDSEGSEPGQTKLAHLPDLPVRLKIKILGCTIEADAQGSAGHFTVQIPVPGRAQLQWDAAAAKPAPDTLPEVEFEATAPLQGRTRRRVTEGEMTAGQLELGPMLSGNYTLRLLWTDAKGERQQLETTAQVQADGIAQVQL